MHYFKLLLTTLFFISSISFAQWVEQNIGTSNTLLDVEFYQNQFGYLSDDQGNIYKTSDNGKTWVNQNYGITDFLNSISYRYGRGLFSLGKNNGTVFLYDNVKASNIGTNLLDIETFSALDVYCEDCIFVVGEDGKIYRSTNTGLAWDELNSGTNANLWSVHFINSFTGYIAGVGIILKTENYGNTWEISYQTQDGDNTKSFKSIYFTDELNGWAVGQEWVTGDALIFHTNDGGTTWEKQNSGVNGFRLQSVYFIDKFNGYACGGKGTILSTIDGGNTWNIEYQDTNIFLRDIYAINGQKVFAVGTNGTIVSKDQQLTVTLDNQILQSGNTCQINIQSENVENAKLEYTTDDGKSWITIEDNFPTTNASYNWIVPNTPSIFCKVKISDVNNLSTFSTTSLFTIFSENKWDKIYSPTDKKLTDIKFNDALNGIAWGDEVLISTNDGGNKWEVVSEFNSGNTSFADNLYGWKLGWENDSNYIFKTTDGGLSWTKVYSEDNGDTEQSYSFGDISFSDRNNGVFIKNGYWRHYGSVHFIYKTNDGGETWTEDKYNDNLDSWGYSNVSYVHCLDSSNYWFYNDSEWCDECSDHFLESYYKFRSTTKSLVTPHTDGEMWVNTSSWFLPNAKGGWATERSGENWEKRFYIYNPITGKWKRVYDVFLRGPNKLYFYNSNHGIFGGDILEFSTNYGKPTHNLICETNDGGLTWELIQFEEVDQFSSINSFFSLDGSLFWAVGDRGTILKYTNPISGVEQQEEIIIIDYSLSQNYPNPFNPITKIRYGLPKESKVSLIVYNILGQEVATLVNKEMSAGFHITEFNSLGLSSGIYIYRLTAGNFIQTKKMILMK